MGKYIYIKKSEVNTLSTNRLLNIFRANRKYLFQILSDYGFDTSEGYDSVNWTAANDYLYSYIEFNKIYSLNENIREELNKRRTNEYKN